MTKNHDHSSSGKHEHHHQQQPAWKRMHRDWRVWVAVGLMLAAMFAYVMSFDESLQPDGGVQQPVPAAPGP